MAKKNATKPVADNAVGKKQTKGKEPHTRQERRNQGKEKKGKKEAAKRDRAALIQNAPGYTLAQLEAMNPRKPPEKQPVVTVGEDFLKALPACLENRMSIQRTTSFLVTCGDDAVAIEEQTEEPEALTAVALRNVVSDEIRRLLATTQPLFDGLRDSPELAEAIAAILFEEGGPLLSGQLAEVLVSDQPAEAIADLLEEVGSTVAELQLVTGALNPEYELERSVELEIIEPAEAERLKTTAVVEATRINLRERLDEILAAGSNGGGMIDTALAGLITEGEQAVEAERRKRAQFRQRLARGLHQRKEREGRRFSKSSGESGDEEFIKFLMENRGNLAEVRRNLPIHLREQVESLLHDEERKGPILREIANLTAAAGRWWKAIQDGLSAGAYRPEETVKQTMYFIANFRDGLGVIRHLHGQLAELDRPETPVKPDYRATTSKLWTDQWVSPRSGIYERHLA
mgnify:CR=1 FL=1